MNRSLASIAATALSLALGVAVLPAQADSIAGPGSEFPIVRTGTVDTDFTISSFNVLGSTHTAPGGRHADMPSGVRRIGWALKLLDRHSVDVVGFQELQIDQHARFMEITEGSFGVYPGGVDRRSVQNSIAWRKDQWELLESHTAKIPYFDGIDWDMPYVLLRDKRTGAEAWFANFHNPASSKRRPGAGQWRQEAVAREVALAKRLVQETRRSVFFTGDMNERETYYCQMAGGTPMKAANGGGHKDGVCTPPPNPMPVNWIFGAKRGGKFSNYVRDDSKLVNKVTDHYVVRADVTIAAAE